MDRLAGHLPVDQVVSVVARQGGGVGVGHEPGGEGLDAVGHGHDPAVGGVGGATGQAVAAVSVAGVHAGVVAVVHAAGVLQGRGKTVLNKR